MTPKEKAEDLIDSFIRDGYDIIMSEKLAIRCALIAVNELILYAYNSYFYNYWSEVKQEIEKL